MARRWVHAATTLAVLTIAAVMVIGVITNSRFEWPVWREFFAVPSVLRGLRTTLELTTLSMLIGIALGLGLAVMRLSSLPVASGAAWAYTWFFRGTPLLVQILIWYNVTALMGADPAVGIPFTHVVFFHFQANSIITKFGASVLALGLNEGAYMAEIVRAGILSVDEGQSEAAQSLGLSRSQTMRLVVLPQAMRVIIPPTGNETISMLKTTSLVAVIAFPELLFSVQLIYSANYKVIPLLMVATIWYLVLTSVLTVGQFYLERRFARGATRIRPRTPLQRLRAALRPGTAALKGTQHVIDR